MDTIFQQLWYAFVSRQGGTAHVRTILAPLFDPVTGHDDTIAFYAEGDANPDMVGNVVAVVENAGLYLPERPASSPPTPQEPQPGTPENPAPIMANEPPADEVTAATPAEQPQFGTAENPAP